MGYFKTKNRQTKTKTLKKHYTDLMSGQITILVFNRVCKPKEKKEKKERKNTLEIVQNWLKKDKNRHFLAGEVGRTRWQV